MPQTNELRVFISSTFRDLQEEREHLVKKIFPEIRALCRERGITFTEVDLRWGLTHDEGTYGRVIRTCLEEIDRCRPYFIGITGNRYGYIPEYLEIQKDADLLRGYPWVEQAALEGMSITAMEVRYAVLERREEGKAKRAEVERARFYFRRERASMEDTTADEETRRLWELQGRIRQSGARVQEFRDPASLGELVYDDLIEIIKRDFADAKPPTPLEHERTKHLAFSASRRHAYIANPAYLQRMNQWCASQEPPLVIYAESGSGKSSLVAFWCEQLRHRQPESFIVEHYVGIGAGDTDHVGLIRHIMEEIRERFAREEELPQTPEEIERGLGQWLGYAAHELKKHEQRMVLVLDGLNQLRGSALNLLWIPDVISPEIRLIVTTTVEETLVALRRRGWSEMGMQPLREAEREAVVVRYLSEYHKALPGEVVRQIAEDVKCSHPLFLRTMLEELRLYGEHERIEHHVDRLLASTGTEDLFQRVLERLEEDYNLRAVREVMCLIWASRAGLSEDELAELTGISRLRLSTLLLGLDYHLVRRDGLLGFFHDYLRRAVAKRYLPDDPPRRQTYRRLAEHFERSPVALRSTLELLHALESLGNRERIEEELTRIERFDGIWATAREEVLRLWSGSEASMISQKYRQSLEQWQAMAEPADQCRVLGRVAELLETAGAWPEAETLQRERVAIAETLHDGAEEADARRSLADLLQLQGESDRALEQLDLVQTISRARGDHRRVAAAIDGRGTVHFRRDEYDEALKCYREAEAVCRDLGDLRGVASAILGRGRVHQYRAELSAAMRCNREAEAIARDLGDRRTLESVFNNMGAAFYSQQQMAEALECFSQALEFNRSTGNRQVAAISIGNIGMAHRQIGEYSEALEYLHQAAEQHRSMGFRYGLTFWLAGTAEILVELAEVAEQMPRYLPTYVPEAEPSTWRAASLRAAREQAEECVEVSDDITKSVTLFRGRVVLARIAAAEGDAATAVDMLNSMLRQDTHDSARAELHYWLWKFAPDGKERNRAAALRLYEQLSKQAPTLVYPDRIDELTAATQPTPPEADDATDE